MTDPITAPPIAKSGHLPMEAVHVDDREWETLRWEGQWSKMLFHPRPERPTEPNAGLGALRARRPPSAPSARLRPGLVHRRGRVQHRGQDVPAGHDALLSRSPFRGAAGHRDRRRHALRAVSGAEHGRPSRSTTGASTCKRGVRTGNVWTSERAGAAAMLLTNARIYTLDGAGTIADTLVVRDGRIAFVGRQADVNPGVGEAVHDLGGRAVLPGLVDAHGHLMHLARGRLSFDVRGLTSEEEIARRVGDRAAVRPLRRVDHRAQLGPEPLAQPRVPLEGLARPDDARASGGPGAHRRSRHVGELGRARRRRHRSTHAGPGRRPHRPRRQG